MANHVKVWSFTFNCFYRFVNLTCEDFMGNDFKESQNGKSCGGLFFRFESFVWSFLSQLDLGHNDNRRR